MDLGKLFIGGISWDTNEDRLREYFQVFGDVLEAVIMKDVEAKKAVPRDDQNILNRTSNNSSLHGSPGPTRTKKIFVGGLASTVTETDFKNYFDQFGTITDVVVMYDHNTQRPRGFGFITFDSEEAVDKVLYKTFHELNGKMVEVKRAVPKELSSSGPARSNQFAGYNYGITRVNSFLNGYSPQAHNPNSVGLRMDGRFMPVTASRSSFSPFNSGYGSGPGGGLGPAYNNVGGGEFSVGLGGGGYGRNSGAGFAPVASRAAAANGGYDRAAYADIYENSSLYGDSSWRSPTSELFDSGIGNAASDVITKNTAAYAGGYGIADRQSDRGKLTSSA
ncbi:unnamed protein product [Linum tenue]|uniref:RRM domain-containing protein n=1 Tax=Linum tenue TaxID=586396 RepID=A0AAV0M1B5_9ROSI|nr:unnamed protein product [Linum tenue]